MISQMVGSTPTPYAAVELTRVEGPPLFHGTDPGAKALVQVYRLGYQGAHTFLPGDACRIFSGDWEDRHNDVSRVRTCQLLHAHQAYLPVVKNACLGQLLYGVR
jgi:hypothetical protein